MGKKIKVWYDKEGDYLEVLFRKKGRVLQGDTKRCGNGKSG